MKAIFEDNEALLALLKENRAALGGDVEDVTELKVNVIRDYFDRHWGVRDMVAELNVKIVRAGAEEDLVLFGKSGEDATIRQVHERLTYLYEHGFGEGLLQAARSLIYSDEFDLIVQNRAGTETLRSRVEHAKSADAVADYVATAGRWIAKLHNTPLPPGDSFPMRRQHIEVASLAEVFSTVPGIPIKMDELVVLSKKLFKTEDRLNSEYPMTIVHGDFHPENLLFENGIVRVIDFLESHRGNPLFDLGSFLSQLRTQSMYSPAESQFDVLRVAFLDAYYEDSNAVGTHVGTSDLNFFELLVEFRNLIHYLIELPKFTDEQERREKLEGVEAQYDKILQDAYSIS